MNKRTINLNNLIIASPCPADWHQMIGDDRMRFCQQCNLNVYNIANLTEAAAIELITNNETRFCGRLYRRADGTVLTADCPVGIKIIRRRVTRIAQATLAAILSLTAPLIANAQSPQDKLQEPISTVDNRKSRIEGKILDQTGAVIAGAEVVLIDVDTGNTYTATTNENGVYKLPVPGGLYKLRVEGAGFKTAEATDIKCRDGFVTAIDIKLQAATEGVEVTIGIICPDSNQPGGTPGVNRPTRDNQMPRHQPYTRNRRE